MCLSCWNLRTLDNKENFLCYHLNTLWYLAFILLSATSWDWIHFFFFSNPLFTEDWLITLKGQIVPHQNLKCASLSNPPHCFCSPDHQCGEFSTDNEMLTIKKIHTIRKLPHDNTIKQPWSGKESRRAQLWRMITELRKWTARSLFFSFYRL